MEKKEILSRQKQPLYPKCFFFFFLCTKTWFSNLWCFAAAHCLELICWAISAEYNNQISICTSAGMFFRMTVVKSSRKLFSLATLSSAREVRLKERSVMTCLKAPYFKHHQQKRSALQSGNALSQHSASIGLTACLSTLWRATSQGPSLVITP